MGRSLPEVLRGLPKRDGREPLDSPTRLSHVLWYRGTCGKTTPTPQRFPTGDFALQEKGSQLTAASAIFRPLPALYPAKGSKWGEGACVYMGSHGKGNDCQEPKGTSFRAELLCWLVSFPECKADAPRRCDAEAGRQGLDFRHVHVRPSCRF